MDVGMTESTIKITKLTAPEGFVLTNGRAYGRTVYLGKNDKAENWYAITKQQYDTIMEAASVEE